MKWLLPLAATTLMVVAAGCSEPPVDAKAESEAEKAKVGATQQLSEQELKQLQSGPKEDK